MVKTTWELKLQMLRRSWKQTQQMRELLMYPPLTHDPQSGKCRYGYQRGV